MGIRLDIVPTGEEAAAIASSFAFRQTSENDLIFEAR